MENNFFGISVITRSGAGEASEATEGERTTPYSKMATAAFAAPTMDWSDDSGLVERLKTFRRECKLIFGVELKEASDNIKALKIIKWGGIDAEKQFRAWGVDDDDLTVEEVWKKFDEYCKSNDSYMRARLELMCMKQDTQEKLISWFERVQAQILLCKYDKKTAELLLCDTFVLKMSDREMAGKIVTEVENKKEDKYTYKDALEKARALDNNKKSGKLLDGITPSWDNQVLAMHAKDHHGRPQRSSQWEKGRKYRPQSSKNYPSDRQVKETCIRCGGPRHANINKECPALGKSCIKCGVKGHYAKVCRKGSKKQSDSNRAQQVQVQVPSAIEPKFHTDQRMQLTNQQIKICPEKKQCNQVKDRVGREEDEKKLILVTLPYSLHPSRKCKQSLRMRVDTCADVNMMPKGVYQELFSDIGLEKITPTHVSVSTYTDEAIQILGKCDLYFPHPVSKKKIKATFYVTSGEGSVLLSCATTFKLDLISVRPRLNEVPNGSIVYTSTLDTPQLTDRYKVNLLNVSMENWRLDESPDEVLSAKCPSTEEHSSKKYNGIINSEKYNGVINNEKYNVITREEEHYNDITTQDSSTEEHSSEKYNGIINNEKYNVINHYNTVNAVTTKDAEPKPITSKEMLKEQFPDVFTGIGRFPGEPYQFKLDPNVPPKQVPHRSAPIHQQPALKAKIDEMLESGVLVRVEPHEFTPWINSYVAVESVDKDGKLKLRVCLDPRNLNEAIIREPYKFITPDELSAKLAGAKVITVTDCSKGFWHEVLTYESSLLTAFNCDLGKFRFTRMPFGINVAGDVFQRKLDHCIGDIENVYCIADDIMVIGYEEDHSDHDKSLQSLFERAEECNIKFNYDKIRFKKKEVTFFGETYTTDGRKPDPGKVEAILNLKLPENKKELQSFLGMVNYLGKFTPELACLTEPLRFLIRKNVPYNWNAEHTEAVNAIKKEIANAGKLKHFDPSKETVLQTDASIKGLGACLLQEEKPVFFASRSLSSAEKNYTAIELESLAVSWAMEKFRHFIYGKKFKLETDQKPLEIILNRSQGASTPRLQRLLDRAFQYDFDVKYIKGETNVIADCLSRLGGLTDRIELPRLTVHALTVTLPATEDFLQRLKEETDKDAELQLLKQQITQGWPRRIKKVDSSIRPYWSFREDLTIQEDVLLKGT